MAIRHRPLLLFAAAACLLAMPAGSAQGATVGIHNPTASSPVTLYMHLIDFQDFPINTQQPDDHYTANSNVGLGTSTLSCTPSGAPGLAHGSFHTLYGYSSPSYVEYQQESEGKPRVHPERGISYDAHIDSAAPFTLYWYLSTLGPSSGVGPADPNSIPEPIANVVVQATMRAGDGISVNDHAYNSGPVLVHGQTEPATLLADQVLPGASGTKPATVTALGQHDGRWLYEFAVPMTVDEPTIPKASGYNLRVDVYMDSPACDDPTGPGGALMPNVVAIHSSKDYRPRMQFAITNPLMITALHPQFVGDEPIVHAAINAAWGNYDVAEPSVYTPNVKPDAITLTIDGPTPSKGLQLVSTDALSKTNPHFHHQEDVLFVYDWPYKADQAKDGLYTVTLTVGNDQGTAVATGVSQFEIGRNEALGCTDKGCAPEVPPESVSHKGAPGLGLPALLAAVAVAGVAATRRLR